MKTILITGALGGIGSVLVHSFAENNWRVIAVDVEQSKSTLDNATFMKCDLSNVIAVQELCASIVQVHQRVDALINCAAAQHIGAINELSSADWDKTFAVNVRAPWLLMQGLYPSLRYAAATQGRASIINISSIHALATSARMAAYASSKAALNGLTRSASIEYALDGIRVNSIVPGAVATPMLVEHLHQDQIDKLLSRQLIPQLIEPSAIADMAAYLLSDAAQNVTGQEFVIDSGVLPQLATEMD